MIKDLHVYCSLDCRAVWLRDKCHVTAEFLLRISCRAINEYLLISNHKKLMATLFRAPPAAQHDTVFHEIFLVWEMSRCVAVGAQKEIAVEFTLLRQQ